MFTSTTTVTTDLSNQTTKPKEDQAPNETKKRSNDNDNNPAKSAKIEYFFTSEEEKEASEFSQWIFHGVQAGQFTIEGLVDCLLSEQHNQVQRSFERFKQALTYLKVEFPKGKESFFEANFKAKDRNKEDLIALRIAAENAVEKVLKNESLEGRPSNASNISAVLKTIETSRNEREALGFSQWIFHGVQAGQFTIEGLVECLLSEQHNQVQRSFERFKQALTYLKVEFPKGKESFFEANFKAKDRNKEDLIALRIAAENAVEKVLKNESLEGRPSNASNISAVLEAIKTSRHDRLAKQMQQVADDYPKAENSEEEPRQSVPSVTPYKDAKNVATSDVTQQLVNQQKEGANIAYNS